MAGVEVVRAKVMVAEVVRAEAVEADMVRAEAMEGTVVRGGGAGSGVPTGSVIEVRNWIADAGVRSWDVLDGRRWPKLRRENDHMLTHANLAEKREGPLNGPNHCHTNEGRFKRLKRPSPYHTSEGRFKA